MARTKLTDAKLKALKPEFPKSKRYKKAGAKLGPKDRCAHMDIAPSGFGVRVTAGGRKTFVLRARYPGPEASAHYSWRALGEYPALSLERARAGAGEWLVLIKQGKDPAVLERDARALELKKQALARDNTFEAVAIAWFAAKVSTERRAHEVEIGIRNNFFGEWAGWPITEIGEDDVFAVIKKKSATAPSHARNLLGNLKRFFQWAIDQRAYGITASPCEKLNATKTIGKKKQKRRRVLDDAEILAFWRASKRMACPFGPAYQLLLYSGLRLNEAVDARKSELDRSKGLWTIPAERMKGTDEDALAHVVPMTPEITGIFDSLPEQEGDYVFTKSYGRKPVWIGTAEKKRLDALMTEELQALDPPVAFKPFVNHDIRRTVRTRMSRLKVSEEAREAVLAHRRPGIKGTYDAHDYLDEKREALEMWAAHLRTIIDPQPNNVVELHARA